ncbi:MAG: hypothetical protein ABWK01_06730 [Infirmifilum sp.]
MRVTEWVVREAPAPQGGSARGGCLGSKLWMFLEGSYVPSPGELEALKRVAGLNKLYLAFLRRARGVFYGEWLREEARFRWFARNAVEVVRALEGLDYALFKFRRPVDHVSVDLDVLVDAGNVPAAASRLRGLGFRVVVWEPYTVTLERRGFVVDLYAHPSFAWVVYMDGGLLLEEAEDAELNGVHARVLTESAEAVVAAAHAVYKEHMVLLLDCMTVERWADGSAEELSRALKAHAALQLVEEVCRSVRSGAAEAPYRLPLPVAVRVLAGKAAVDPHTRATLLNALRYLSRRDFGRGLAWRILRESY